MSREVICSDSFRKNHILPSGLGADQGTEVHEPEVLTILSIMDSLSALRTGCFHDRIVNERKEIAKYGT